MLFTTLGNKSNPAVLFFHAMGVTGASSEPVAKALQAHYFCILPGRFTKASRTRYGRSKCF